MANIPYGNKKTTNKYVIRYWKMIDWVNTDEEDKVLLESIDPALAMLIEPFKDGYRDAVANKKEGYRINIEITNPDLLIAMNEMYMAGRDAGCESIYA